MRCGKAFPATGFGTRREREVPFILPVAQSGIKRRSEPYPGSAPGSGLHRKFVADRRLPARRRAQQAPERSTVGQSNSAPRSESQRVRNEHTAPAQDPALESGRVSRSTANPSRFVSSPEPTAYSNVYSRNGRYCLSAGRLRTDGGRPPPERTTLTIPRGPTTLPDPRLLLGPKQLRVKVLPSAVARLGDCDPLRGPFHP